jgi:predicted nucleic acid-binding Zn ribbon protein
LHPATWGLHSNWLTGNDTCARQSHVAFILDGGRASKFQFEGACRAGLRSRFCLSGSPWAEADKNAHLIVVLALHRIGASRPTWQQGQPDYDERTQERWFCSVCGGRIESDTRWKWCSDECKAVAVQRSTESRMRADAQAARAAFWAARAKGEWLEGNCAHCGRRFRQTNEGSRGALKRYCSRKCYLAVRVADRARTCPTCGRGFERKAKGQRYCSPTCGKRAPLPNAPQRSCLVCGTVYTDRSRAGLRRFCSGACGKRHRRAAGFACEAA